MAIPKRPEEADEYVASLIAPWRDQLIASSRGQPKAVLANVITALRCAPEWAGKLQFDAFYQRTMIDGTTPWSDVHERRIWYPNDDMLATDWIQHQGIYVGDETVNKAIETVARDQTFHPVLDYLKPLEWDREPRLDNWVIRYLGVEPSPYARSAGAKFLISAIARVMRPGCKADCALILEGRQGIMKSTAFRVLFSPWYTDEISELGSKDAAMQMAGVWGIELAELEGMNKAETSRIKASLSRSTDRYRPPWGRRVIDQPRQCVFCGTVNHNEYLRDETGGRRFWPLAAGRIDIDGLQETRDQLFAEALFRYAEGESWWLDNATVIAAATNEQRARRQPDVWDESVADFVQDLESVLPSEYLISIGLDIKDQDQRDQNRVSAILKFLGWERRSIRFKGIPRYRYVRKEEDL